jgi:hypothetical protein
MFIHIKIGKSCMKYGSFLSAHVLFRADAGFVCSIILVLCYSCQHLRKTYRSQNLEITSSHWIDIRCHRAQLYSSLGTWFMDLFSVSDLGRWGDSQVHLIAVCCQNEMWLKLIQDCVRWQTLVETDWTFGFYYHAVGIYIGTRERRPMDWPLRGVVTFLQNDSPFLLYSQWWYMITLATGGWASWLRLQGTREYSSIQTVGKLVHHSHQPWDFCDLGTVC